MVGFVPCHTTCTCHCPVPAAACLLTFLPHACHCLPHPTACHLPMRLPAMAFPACHLPPAQKHHPPSHHLLPHPCPCHLPHCPACLCLPASWHACHDTWLPAYHCTTYWVFFLFYTALHTTTASSLPTLLHYHHPQKTLHAGMPSPSSYGGDLLTFLSTGWRCARFCCKTTPKWLAGGKTGPWRQPAAYYALPRRASFFHCSGGGSSYNRLLQQRQNGRGHMVTCGGISSLNSGTLRSRLTTSVFFVPALTRPGFQTVAGMPW